MSENDNCLCAGPSKVAVKGHVKEHLKRKALSRPRKTDIEHLLLDISLVKCNSMPPYSA